MKSECKLHLLQDTEVHPVKLIYCTAAGVISLAVDLGSVAGQGQSFMPSVRFLQFKSRLSQIQGAQYITRGQCESPRSRDGALHQGKDIYTHNSTLGRSR